MKEEKVSLQWLLKMGLWDHMLIIIGETDHMFISVHYKWLKKY